MISDWVPQSWPYLSDPVEILFRPWREALSHNLVRVYISFSRLLQSRILIFHCSHSGFMISALEFFVPVWYKKKLETWLAPHAASCINEEQEHWCSASSMFPVAAVIPAKDVVVLSHRTFFYCRRALDGLAERSSPLPRKSRTKTTLSCRQQQKMCEVERWLAYF